MLVRYPQIVFIVISMIFLSLPVYSATIPLAKFTELDTQFEKLSSEIYKNSFFKLKNNKIKNIQALYKITTYLNDEGKYLNAIKYIVDNKKLIKNNIDDDSIFFFIDLLLTHNEWNTVYSLYKHILQDGDKSLVSNVKFMFVKYYISRNEWQQTLNLLTDIVDDLTLVDAHYALIMQGIAFQNLKKHRKALQFYRKVPVTSTFYNYAQLNIAIVFIRQGWWSDAHRIMNNLLKVEDALYGQEEFVNRLYLVMGYSLLQQEYFRESRESFRNVKINSKYANRALLGISLSSASQGDNIGSLNILNILQDKKSLDLAVEESYLLLPYVYEKLGQHRTASGSYTIALNYYEKRVVELSSIIQSLKIESLKNITISGSTIVIRNNSIDFSESYPVSFLNNLNEIKTFQKHTLNSNTDRKVKVILNQYNTILLKVIKEKLETRKSHIQDYLNQSRFGIARLYDNSKEKQKKKNNDKDQL